jgi:acetolactate synthase-1/3 small subunit
MRHIISLLLENEAGPCPASPGFSAAWLQHRIAYRSPTEDPTLSRMTIVTTGSDDVIEQITKQLNNWSIGQGRGPVGWESTSSVSSCW